MNKLVPKYLFGSKARKLRKAIEQHQMLQDLEILYGDKYNESTRKLYETAYKKNKENLSALAENNRLLQILQLLNNRLSTFEGKTIDSSFKNKEIALLTPRVFETVEEPEIKLIKKKTKKKSQTGKSSNNTVVGPVVETTKITTKTTTKPITPLRINTDLVSDNTRVVVNKRITEPVRSGFFGGGHTGGGGASGRWQSNKPEKKVTKTKKKYVPIVTLTTVPNSGGSLLLRRDTPLATTVEERAEDEGNKLSQFIRETFATFYRPSAPKIVRKKAPTSQERLVNMRHSSIL